MDSRERERIAGYLGLAAPLAYVVLMVLLGLETRGYNHFSDLMSELGAVGSPFGSLMNIAGFIMLGTIVMIMSYALHREVSGGKGSVIGPVMIAFSGAGLIGVGLFPCDPLCINTSVVASFHITSAVVAAVAALLGLFFMSQRFNRDSDWRGLSHFTYLMIVVSVAAWMVFLFVATESWMGLFQKLAMGGSLVWVEVISYKMLTKSGFTLRGQSG
jgi:hypothetical protein